MSGNELTVSGGELAKYVDGGGLGEAIKPLVKEIHLFDSHIAGTYYIEDKTVFDEIKVGDKLVLQREDNKFDEKAILVLSDSKKKLGYIPERDNIIFSRLMDAGKFLFAKVTSIEREETFTSIRIGIYLTDF